MVRASWSRLEAAGWWLQLSAGLRYTGYWGSLTSPSTKTPAQALGGKVVSCAVLIDS